MCATQIQTFLSLEKKASASSSMKKVVVTSGTRMLLVGLATIMVILLTKG